MKRMPAASAQSFASADFGFRSLQRDQRAFPKRFDIADIGQVGAKVRFVHGLAGRIDNEEQVAAEIRHHQIIKMLPSPFVNCA